MRSVSHLSLGALTAACLCTQGVRADWVAFQDDFEDETIGTVLGPPQIGQAWNDTSIATPPASPANGLQVIASPAGIGSTNSMTLKRQDGYNGSVKGISLPGVLVPGNVVEVKWQFNLEGASPLPGRFNGPMQVSLGHVGSQFNNQLAFIQISDANAAPLTGGGAFGYYIGPGHFSGGLHHSVNDDPNTRVRASLNAPGGEGKWDSIRAVLTIQALNATQLTGTMDLFVNSAEAGLGEVQIANDTLLETTNIPGVDPTSLQFHAAIGVSTSAAAYDNIVVTVVPEPTMGLAAAGLGMLLIRRTRK